ncbi:FAD-dependent oxidoreductase [Pseudonocardia sp. NPDC046786]|uniref:NAD(P)/FAD-dependent oxidoreductase n=1 Tax=Pseudonocardia sp. NPDC046786 TaxID=3155471 RepID=UPI003403506D
MPSPSAESADEHPAGRADVLVVGAGHGGAQVAIALRQQGFTGSVTIVGEEPYPPYQRPPLSKDYLAGTTSADRLPIRPRSFWENRGVALLTGRRIVAIDPVARTVSAEDGSRLGYGQLVWAAGGRARRLTCPGADLPGIHTIRTRADVDRLAGELTDPARVVVVGGGYIGLEVAAVLTDRVHVTVLEAAGRVLVRVAGEPLSRFYETEHRRRGVDIRLGVTVVGVRGDARGVTGVELACGTVLPCSVVVVGIGIEPESGPMRDAGAAVDNGVLVDGDGRTSIPGVFALGDCAIGPFPGAGGTPVRLESVQAAVDQAVLVACAVTGRARPTRVSPPTFWSDQYDLHLKAVGLALGHDSVVVRGDPADRSFSVVYLRGDTVLALDCVNATKDFAQGRSLVAERAAVDPVALADPSTPLLHLDVAHR